MTNPAVAAELEPRFLVTVTLDGDDDPQEQTYNFVFALDMALAAMRSDELIRDYSIKRAP